MQANTTSPRLRVSDVASWMVATFGIILLVLLFLSFALETRAPAPTPAVTSPNEPRIAYFEFGAAADTLWLASAGNPAKREAALVVPHAGGFGVVPSISPSRSQVAYTALAPDTAAPGPDAPAGVWLASMEAAEPRLLTNRADLLVAPVWSPEADRIVFRRSDASGYSLVEVPVDGGAERVLVSTTSDEALFPVGFTPDGATFYHVALSESGTALIAIDMATQEQTSIAPLADGLSREWTLSPDGTWLAYLALTHTGEAINSRAYVMNLDTATAEPVSDLEVDAFGPIWQAGGGLIIGTVDGQGEGSFVEWRDGNASQLLESGAGFDVPLASLPGGAYLVRAFDGASASAPGRATLTLIDPNGERHALSSGDVTYVGWSAP